MTKLWQIWSLYFICLAAVTIAMAWLSLKTIRLDASREADRAETEMARREAELQGLVSSALYRMDLMMLPIVAQEAARPENHYRSFTSIAAAPGLPQGASAQAVSDAANPLLPSPLLFQHSPYVLLHFQIDVDNDITSPQFPEAQDRLMAVQDYQFDERALQQTLANMERAQQLFAYQALLQEDIAVEGAARILPEAAIHDASPPAMAYNVPAVENFRNQLQSQSTVLAKDTSSNKLDAQRSRSTQRVNDEFSNRRDSTQEFTQQTLANNSYAYGNTIASGIASQFADASSTTEWSVAAMQTVPMQPMWIGSNLILARRVNSERGNVFQCCWLNWEKIKVGLQNQVAELLPQVDFEPVKSDTELKIGTALTTIPVQLIVERPKMLAKLALDSPLVASKSVVPISLLAAWLSLGLAALASGLLLHGVLRLSERRAAFVSAVTHELRTPLTTFRMYSEMLAEGMVPPEKQRQYANTLKVQADRLSYLVENVLQFARLERGPAKIADEKLTVTDLLERFRSRLEERVSADHMQLIVDVEESLAQHTLATQPAAIEQILFNLVDNSCKYARSSDDNRIVLSVSSSRMHVRFCVRDFGPGISPLERKRMFQPFYQSRFATANAVSGVGLGLALCTRMAASLGGRLVNKDCPSGGAMFILEIPI